MEILVLAYLVLIFCVWLAGGCLGGLLWPYVFNTILKIQGREPKVKFINGFLIGLVPGIGYLCIPASVIIYIAVMLVIPKKEKE
jgi:hypothetical protein